LHGENGNIVGPLIERSATGQVETGMVPMARQNALFDSSTVEWKTHVWTPVVHGVDLASSGEHRQRVFFDMDNYTLSALQVSELSHTHVPSAQLWFLCVSDHGFSPPFRVSILDDLGIVVRWACRPNSAI
jgi:hypothetical protein